MFPALSLIGVFFKANWRLFAIAAVAATLVFGWNRFIHHVENRGYEKGKAEVQAQFDAYVKAIEKKNEEVERARLQLIAHQDAVVQEMATKLDEAEKRASRVKIVTKEIHTYVTKEADEQCVVPAGAVWVLNAAVSTESSAQDPGLSLSGFTDVDAPSGVELSELVGISASNLAECVVRGEVIEAWQSWYKKNAQLWQDFQKSVEKSDRNFLTQ